MKAVRNHFMLAITIGTALAAATIAGWSKDIAAQNREGSAQVETTQKDEPFFMLNALWFKPDGGAAKYEEYLKAAGPFVAKHGGKSTGAFVPEASLIGKFDADLVFFVEWPSQSAFNEFVKEPGYQAVSHLRDEAIRDSLLVRCRPK